ncbi:hypothetical protein K3495_g5741 [Podosphaera aphanis]|nr:hypothetical protein K3495_g5741 [Podosphaera aphanis]
MDETPIPFEFADGYTYSWAGEKTIKCYISRIRTKVISHGIDSDRSAIRKTEEHLYHPGVTIEFNGSAHNTEELMLEWLDEEFFPLVRDRSHLIALDQGFFHRTQRILQHMRENYTTPEIVSSGCMSFVQPLDTAVSKTFKDKYLLEQMDIWEEERRLEL